MDSAPVLDAQRVAEMEEELATLRQSDAQAQRNLRRDKRHLSEERARVAELHARLIGRSGSFYGCEREMIEAAIASRVQAEGELEVESEEQGASWLPGARARCKGKVPGGSKRTIHRDRRQSCGRWKELAMDSVQEGVTIADF